MRRKPITHISGNMAYRFSDLPVLVDGDTCVADGRIWIEYTCDRDESGWDIDWDFDNFDDLDVYAPDGNKVIVLPPAVFDQITAILSRDSFKIREEVYDHAVHSF
jgi:hypothetical protein